MFVLTLVLHIIGTDYYFKSCGTLSEREICKGAIHRVKCLSSYVKKVTSSVIY